LLDLAPTTPLGEDEVDRKRVARSRGRRMDHSDGEMQCKVSVWIYEVEVNAGGQPGQCRAAWDGECAGLYDSLGTGLLCAALHRATSYRTALGPG
jgi:hypothetical protein